VPGEGVWDILFNTQNMEKQKELNDQFKRIISERFEVWNEAQEGPPDFEKFVKYLVGCSLIPQKEINRFMVVDCYPKILETFRYNKNL
jgi:hypothetical protein